MKLNSLWGILLVLFVFAGGVALGREWKAQEKPAAKQVHERTVYQCHCGCTPVCHCCKCINRVDQVDEPDQKPADQPIQPPDEVSQ